MGITYRESVTNYTSDVSTRLWALFAKCIRVLRVEGKCLVLRMVRRVVDREDDFIHLLARLVNPHLTDAVILSRAAMNIRISEYSNILSIRIF